MGEEEQRNERIRRRTINSETDAKKNRRKYRRE